MSYSWRQSKKEVINQSFNGIISRAYICGKYSYCLELVGNEEHIKLTKYGSRPSNSDWIKGDSVSKEKGVYFLIQFRKNKGKYEYYMLHQRF